MKAKEYSAAFAAILISVSFISCASAPEKRIESAYIMAYDYENSEVKDVAVYIDDKEAGRTDVYGRLTFPVIDKKEKQVIITLKKEGYETALTAATLKAGQVFYFKIGTAEHYAMSAEELLDKGKIPEAARMIDRALKIENRSDYRFLRDVIAGRLTK